MAVGATDTATCDYMREFSIPRDHAPRFRDIVRTFEQDVVVARLRDRYLPNLKVPGLIRTLISALFTHESSEVALTALYQSAFMVPSGMFVRSTLRGEFGYGDDGGHGERERGRVDLS